jgi:hypothetical protein
VIALSIENAERSPSSAPCNTTDKMPGLALGIIATDRQVECIHHCLTLSPHIAQAVGASAQLWATKGYLQFPDGLLEWLHCRLLAIQLRID